MSFSDEGYELITSFLDPEQLDKLSMEIGSVELSRIAGGVRNAHAKYPCIGELCSSGSVLDKAACFLHSTPTLVRAILLSLIHI